MQQINPQLRIIKDEVLSCTKCPLYKTRIFPVIGQGNHQASIVLVGEAPGFNENKTGRPFCGQAGAVLDELLEFAEIKREDIYICNILKCRPPGNRNPLQYEIDACTPYLVRQLEIIKPKIVCCLGNFASCFIMNLFGLSNQCDGISKIHGRVFEVNDDKWKIKIIPLYHPAVAAYNQNMIESLKNDFKILKDGKLK
ncbi:uracil-DNA glycosylase [Candidatus Peregrinibacteria bacterium]|nr:uracil-DNA glycosylase [Candidatus Peregrinibacteria bacterium]